MNVAEKKRNYSRRAGLAQMCQHIAFALLFVACGQSYADQQPLVAVASSLRSLWPELISTYIRDSGLSAPRASFGSSGLLSTQIINGAPFEVFLSADLASIERLPTEKLASQPRQYAVGKLFLVVPESSPIGSQLSLDTLASHFRRPPTGSLPRLTIPNPIHAPYGKAAREALDSVKIWPLPAGQLLAAENAAQALQFVKSGAVDAAIIPSALLVANGNGLVAVPLPEDSYEPVSHTLVTLTTAELPAQRFAEWLLLTNAGKVFADAGLGRPSTLLNQ